MALAETVAVIILAAIAAFFLISPLLFREVDEKFAGFCALIFGIAAIVFYVGPHLTKWAF